MLLLAGGVPGIFRAIYSSIYDNMGHQHFIIGKLINISEEAAEKAMLVTKAQIDGLTGLYNASTTRELISKRIMNKVSDKSDAFIIIDCDVFKSINDTYGHLQGDKVLESIGENLRLSFRQSDILGRIGGDEFCVYMRDIPSIDFIRTKSQQLSLLIREANPNLSVSVSIGIAILNPKDAGEYNYDSLFKIADDAMYQSKRIGGGQIIIRE